MLRFGLTRAGRVAGNFFLRWARGLPREIKWTEEQVRQFIDTADAMGRSTSELALLCLIQPTPQT